MPEAPSSFQVSSAAAILPTDADAHPTTVRDASSIMFGRGPQTPPPDSSLLPSDTLWVGGGAAMPHDDDTSALMKSELLLLSEQIAFLRERRVVLEHQRVGMTCDILDRIAQLLPPRQASRGVVLGGDGGVLSSSNASSTMALQSTPQRRAIGGGLETEEAPDASLRTTAQADVVMREALQAQRDLQRLKAQIRRQGADVAAGSRQQQAAHQQQALHRSYLELEVLSLREALLQSKSQEMLDVLRTTLRRRDELWKKRTELKRALQHQQQHISSCGASAGSGSGASAVPSADGHGSLVASAAAGSNILSTSAFGEPRLMVLSVNDSYEELAARKAALQKEWEALRTAVSIRGTTPITSTPRGTPTLTRGISDELFATPNKYYRDAQQLSSSGLRLGNSPATSASTPQSRTFSSTKAVSPNGTSPWVVPELLLVQSGAVSRK